MHENDFGEMAFGNSEKMSWEELTSYLGLAIADLPERHR